MRADESTDLESERKESGKKYQSEQNAETATARPDNREGLRQDRTGAPVSL